MQKRLCLLWLCIFFVLGSLSANEIKVIDNNRHGVNLKWQLSKYEIVESKDYTIVQMPGACGLYGVGQPRIPSKQIFIEIPMDAKPIIQISQPIIEVHKVKKPIVPSQEPVTDTIGEQRLARKFAKDASVYSSKKLFPGRVVEIAYQGIMRGRKLVLLRFNPIQYTPKSGEILVYKEFNVSVEFYGATRGLGETDSAMDMISKGLVANYQAGKQKSRGDVEYLILTVEELKKEAQELEKWKNESGLKTKVEVIGHNPTVSTVKDVIKKYYPGVIYVVILADHQLIALPSSAKRHPLGQQRCKALGIEDASVPSDLYYSCLDGDDYYPDVYMGRIPAGSAQEAQVLIGKIIKHQKNPPTGDWFDRFLLCGEFQYQYSNKNTAERLFCETAFTIWNSLKDKYKFPKETVGTGSSGLGHAEYFFRTPKDPNQPEKPGTYRSKINDANPPVINCKMPAEWVKNIKSDSEAKANTLAYWREGAVLVQHRDHGGNTNWGKPSINKNDVATLNNKDKLPILFSINCLTGSMDYSSDCFVEAALKNPNGGAAAAIGSTRVSYSWWNDRLCDGFYTCLFGTDVYDCLDTGVKLPTTQAFSNKLGLVLNFGKMYLALNYPSNPWGTSYDYTETEFYLFHCIGDPDMQIWTAKPTHVEAKLVAGEIIVNAKGAKVNGAQVCLYKKGQQIVRNTNARGRCTINAKLSGTYTLTVTGTNIYPYQTTVTIK